MGCSSSKKFMVRDLEGQDTKALAALRKLELSKEEIDKLYAAFVKFDINGNGFVDLEEFLISMDIEKTVITKEVFNEIDRSDDQQMNFMEFACNIWGYCVKSEYNIACFAFDIYDTDDSQILSKDEIHKMISECYGKRGVAEQLKTMMRKLDVSGDGKITRDEFAYTCKAYPALLFPAFAMQQTLRSHICGTGFWNKIGKRADRILAKPEVREMFRRPGDDTSFSPANNAKGNGGEKKGKGDKKEHKKDIKDKHEKKEKHDKKGDKKKKVSPAGR